MSHILLTWTISKIRCGEIENKTTTSDCIETQIQRKQVRLWYYFKNSDLQGKKALNGKQGVLLY